MRTAVLAIAFLAVLGAAMALKGETCSCVEGQLCCWYVNPKEGSKNGTGSIEAPFSTIQAAVERASSGDTIYLMPGDYQLVTTVVIAEMAVLHLEAYDRSASLPRLLDWGIQIQATIGMISNVTISDMIIESSTALRVIGTVSDVMITRVQFLMTGPSSEDVIKLDRLKLGGDGTNSEDEVHGIKFVDCVFDTRASVVSQGTNFFSWRQLIGYGSGGVDDWTPNNRLIFDSVEMRGHERGALQVFLDSAPFVSLVRSSLYHTAFTADDAIDYDVSYNFLNDSGVLFTGNVTNTTISRNTFQNVGNSFIFPSLIRPTCLTFMPSLTTNASYENVGVLENTFINISGTNDDPALGYAAIFFATPFQRATYNNVGAYYNDFSRITPPPRSGSPAPISAPPQTTPHASPLPPTTPSGGRDAQVSIFDGIDTNHQQWSVVDAHQEKSVSSKTTLRPRRTGSFAVLSGTNQVDISYNYYGFPQGPSSCCNPDASFAAPQVTPSLVWYPWCLNPNCSETATVPTPDCILCSPLMPLSPLGGQNDNQTMLLIVITVTLAVIILILGLTALYCFKRAKHPEEYALLPTDGWRSRLLASVPDVQALFDQFGVPLINYHDLVLNENPIGTGSFGRVYDGLLMAEHIELHKQMHTLADNQRVTYVATAGNTLSMTTSDFLENSTTANTKALSTFDESFNPRGDGPIVGGSQFSSVDSSYFDSSNPTSPYSSQRSLPSFEITAGGGNAVTENFDFHAEPSFVDTLSSKKKAKDTKKSKSTRATEAKAQAEAKKEEKKSKKKSKKNQPRPIAVKELNSSITDSYEDINQFLEEIKIMASIDHPNLLKLRGVAIVPRTENILLVMDLMDLGSLDDVIFKRKMQLTFARKLAIATEIGYALHYLHSKEPAICHRDLKPGNVLVSHKWNVKVCDFGSSRVLDRKSATMTVNGTPIYLAPESINSSQFSEKSDVYSFGVTLIELFGATRAFDDIAGSATELMIRIAMEGLRPTIPKDLPVSLKSLLRRCMATDPDDRPSFTDILEKLAEVRAASADSATHSLNGDENDPSSFKLVNAPPSPSSKAAGGDDNASSSSALADSSDAQSSSNAGSELSSAYNSDDDSRF